MKSTKKTAAAGPGPLFLLVPGDVARVLLVFFGNPRLWPHAGALSPGPDGWHAVLRPEGRDFVSVATVGGF